MSILKRVALIFTMLLIFTIVYAQDEAPSWCVTVWYPSSDEPTGLDSITENPDIIHIVNPFWYTPQPDGTLRLHSDAEDADKLAAWREAGMRIMPSIFSSISMMIEDDDLRDFHIEQIVELVERMDYDGVDIDYEGFGLHTREVFSVFVEDLAAELHSRDRLISIAVHPKTDDAGSGPAAGAQDWSRLSPVVDIFQVMTYDYHGRNQPPAPIGPPEWSVDVLRYASSFVDISKVRLGLHFYGYTWQRSRPPATTLTWESVMRAVDAFDLEIQRDPADMEAFVEFKPRGLPSQTIYFADAESTAYKLNIALEEFPDLGGVAIWGLGGEDPANWDVLRSIGAGECSFTKES